MSIISGNSGIDPGLERPDNANMDNGTILTAYFTNMTSTIQPIDWEEQFCRYYFSSKSTSDYDLDENYSTFNNSFNNYTIELDTHTDPLQKVNVQLNYYLNHIALPIICSFGILGNLLNLVILTRKRMLRKMDQMEKSGCIGLVALAMSDLLFCAVRIPHAFYPGDSAYTYKSFWLYYTIYRGALHNTFIMTGTWLTVTIATGRCIVVCFPLHARKAIMFTYIRATITAVFIISILFSLPRYFIYKLVEIDCKESGRLYMMETRWNKPNDSFLHIYKICWAFVGIIVPFILLLTANICLIRALHKSYKVRKASYVKASRGNTPGEWNSRLTHTLIGVVVLFFCLSAPAELLKFFKGLVESNVNNFYKYQIAMVVTNFMQSCNSAINFVLYYTINIPFRKTIRHLFWAQVTRKCPGARRKLFQRCFTYSESPQRITADSAKSNTDSVKYGLTNETWV